MLRYLRSFALATCMAAVFLVAPTVRGSSTSDEEMGRWKDDGNGGCYWEPEDDGPDQCDPNNPDGRYKLDGNGGCYWEQNDFGDDQCTPDEGGGVDEPLDDGGQAGTGGCVGNAQSWPGMAIATKGRWDGQAVVYTLSVDSGLSTSAANAIEVARNALNLHTGTTKVRIDPVSSGGDLHFWRNDTKPQGVNITAGLYGNPQGCGDGGAQSGRPSFPQDVSDRNSQADLEPLAMHELLHAMGVADGVGIMKQLVRNSNHRTAGLHPEDCYDVLRDRPGHGGTHTTIQPGNVENLIDCLSQIWASTGRTFDGGFREEQIEKTDPADPSTTCYELWKYQITKVCQKTTTGPPNYTVISMSCSETKTPVEKIWSTCR